MTLRGSSFGAALATVILTVASHAQTPTPNVKKLGNAIREYQDSKIHAVVAYEYSNRHHDAGWLFIDAGVRTTDRLVFHRGDFTLTTPDEKTVMLAQQSQFVDDSPRINHIRQNARIWNRDLNAYFIDKRNSSNFRLFALPGEGVVTDSIATETYGPSFTTLYFQSPTAGWPSGSYQLVIDNGKARAVIPIELK
jgi:hypothetical protein